MQRERGVQSAGTLSFSRESDYTYQNIQSPVDQTVLSLIAILHEYDQTTKQLSITPPVQKTQISFIARRLPLYYMLRSAKKNTKSSTGLFYSLNH